MDVPSYPGDTRPVVLFEGQMRDGLGVGKQDQRAAKLERATGMPDDWSGRPAMPGAED